LLGFSHLRKALISLQITRWSDPVITYTILGIHKVRYGLQGSLTGRYWNTSSRVWRLFCCPISPFSHLIILGLILGGIFLFMHRGIIGALEEKIPALRGKIK